LDKTIPGLSPQSAAPKIRKPKRLPMRTTVSAMVFTFAVSAACADATNGEHLAQRWCASCHTGEQTSPRSAARSLATIARSPDFGREKLAIFLLLFHPKMPETSLTQSEASDLAEYIASLGRAE
jgi:cytochrome c2